MNIFDFLGHFHPLIVHLPIGILLLFVIIGLLQSEEKLLKSIDLFPCCWEAQVSMTSKYLPVIRY